MTTEVPAMAVGVRRGGGELLQVLRELLGMRVMMVKVMVMIVEVRRGRRGRYALQMLPEVAVVAVGDITEGFPSRVVGSRRGHHLRARLEGDRRVLQPHVHAAGVAVGHLAREEAQRVKRVASARAVSVMLVMSFSLLIVVCVRVGGRDQPSENGLVLLLLK